MLDSTHRCHAGQNYPITFWHKIGDREIKWKSVQHAYQVQRQLARTFAAEEPDFTLCDSETRNVWKAAACAAARLMSRRRRRRRGAREQAAKFRDERVIGWIAEAATVKEAREIAREYDRPPFVRPDFRAVNVGEMYRIVLAKFAQNPRLGRWLVDTDRPGDMPPIFHTDESSDFWGLGPLGPPRPAAGGAPACGPAGEAGELAQVYSGQNLNGQVCFLLGPHYFRTLPFGFEPKLGPSNEQSSTAESA